MIAWLTEPWTHEFMVRALAVAAMSGLVCGIVGVYVVLRGMAFIGDAVAHAVFPGVAIAFVLQADLLIGGALAGLATTMTIAFVAQNRRLQEDAVIGVFFAAAFGLGIVILSTAPGYSGSLESFLFGPILGISDADVRLVAVFGTAVVVVALLLRRPLVALTLDRETARAARLPILGLDLALYALVTLAIVISLQAVGNVLVLALLVTPAATARLLTDRFSTMLWLAPLLGVVATVTGLYLSYAFNLAAGGLIVLVATGIFVSAWTLAPRHGLVARMRTRRVVLPSGASA